MQTTTKRALTNIFATSVFIAFYSASTAARAAGSKDKEAELYVSGGITTVVQKIQSSAPEVANYGSALSADLFLEKDIHDGKALMYINHSQGSDPLPNSNADYEGSSGEPGKANYDEGFSGTRIAEAFYEAPLTSTLVVTVGMISPQRYFDNNNVASDQTRQFLGSPFINNSAIEFPGYRSVHAYPGGIRLSTTVGEHVLLQGALFEDAKDYSGTFEHTFAIAEADLVMESAGATTHLRFIAWKSNKNQTSGIALSADRDIGEDYTVFVRYGKKSLPGTPPGDATEADLARSLESAFSFGGNTIIDDDYTIGLGFCSETPNSKALAKDSWIEAYASYEVNDSVHITVDLQSIKNKIFGDPVNRAVDSATVVAGRLQVDF